VRSKETWQFAHGHLLRVLVARWLGLPAGAGQHFLLDTGTLNILDYYLGIPALKTWNAPLVGYGSPIVERGAGATTEPVIEMAATPSRVKRTTQ
jgi:broad specificity phosphatase PhoE